MSKIKIKSSVPGKSAHFHKYYSQIKLCRFILLIFAMLYTFGVHLSLRNYTGALFSFAPPAFFIISGFLVLRKSDNTEKRIKRTIKRTAVCFLILFVIYLIMAFVIDKETTLRTITDKSFWADFIALNVWSLPVGSTIWYVQSLLYAYIFIYILSKLNLLKFDIYIALFFLTVTAVVGEFAGVFGFKLFWHTYIGGNFATRAIPYLLLGCFIHRKKAKLMRIRFSRFIAFAVLGLALLIAEFFALEFTDNLVYSGHMIGTPLIAFSLCCMCFFADEEKVQTEYFAGLNRFEMMIPYFICSPIYALLLLPINSGALTYIGGVPEILTTLLSFLLFFVYKKIKKKKEKNKPKSEILSNR